MEETIVSVRVKKDVHAEMRKHDEINWSAVIRRAIEITMKDIDSVDVGRATQAAKNMDKIRKSGIFSGGKSGTEIIRTWRDKIR
ncbi:MAG: hypothetical protein KKE39_04950 [Bacteroidetes bacterium]|nr:hypothetical protein [Bacteroidota bacterium]